MNLLQKVLFAICTTAIAQGVQAQVQTVIANPGENASSEININWHSPQADGYAKVNYAPVGVADVKRMTATANQELVTAFDSMYSKSAANENIYECPHFIRNTVQLKKLRPATLYQYSIEGDTTVRYFRTAPKKGSFRAGIISDWHAYSPLPKRLQSAMTMIDTLESINGGPFDLMIHLGDIAAWGGSYSFWKDNYDQSQFKDYTWAGVNGNHDNMDRTNKKNTNQFFRYVNANPENGYAGEEGVCYYFRYGDILFIVLNNENMRSEEGLAAAQEWVEKVVEENPAPWIIVMEHYQWFFAESGKDSQYGRWSKLFDRLGVDIALAGNNHRYASTHPLRDGKVVAPGEGTIYIQTPSSDNERGADLKVQIDNFDKIKYRWSEGANTIGAMIMDVTPKTIILTLYDRYGNVLDTTTQHKKKKR